MYRVRINWIVLNQLKRNEKMSLDKPLDSNELEGFVPMDLKAWGDEPLDSIEPEGFVPMELADEAFISGLQAMREMLARFVEQGGHPEIAESMRLNWRDIWGKDPGKPETIADNCWSEKI